MVINQQKLCLEYKAAWALLFSLLLLVGFNTPANCNYPNANELVKKMDDVMRSSSNDMLVTLNVKTKSWQRDYKMHVWMKGLNHAFARILEPSKISGQGFLRINSKLWNYLPTAERTLLIPPSMMTDKLLGSDFTNDDVVKLTYLPRDYEGNVVGGDKVDNTSSYHLLLKPKENAPVVYGKLELWLRQTDCAPLRIEFYDDKMKLLRTLHYSNFKKYGKHEMPSHWRMENNKDPGRETILSVLEASFDIPISDSIFTKENLEKK